MAEPHVLILGPPGAGKGTQSANVAERFDVEHVTTGDALRANKDMDITEYDLEYDTPAGYMDAGDLVPDVVVDAMVEEALSAADGFVLDGYPRNAAQARELDGMTDLDAIVSLSVPGEELVRRLTGRRVCSECGENYHVDFDPPEEPGVCDACGGELIQREDDDEASVRNRLSVFAEETEPVIDRYSDREAFVDIDGDQPPEDVWADIEAAITERIEG